MPAAASPRMAGPPIALRSGMTIYRDIILGLWLLFAGYWAVSAIGVKRSVGGWAWRRQVAVRLIIALGIAVALRNHAVAHAVRQVWFFAADVHPPLAVPGVVLCAFGIGLAIAARRYLGRNWGPPMSRKEDPELVTRGPYAVIRHPIYTGILLALLGSAIGDGLFWLLPLVLAGAYFIVSARREEKLMCAQFPQQYPAYMKRTRMLLPFLL